MSDAPWDDFTRRLADCLRALHRDQYLIIERKDRNWFVQFVVHGPDGTRAEMVSNAFLEGDDVLAEAALNAAVALGWKPPTVVPGAAADGADTNGSPNYHVDRPAPVDCDELAQLAVTTLTTVLQADSAELLAYSAFTDDRSMILLPTLGIDRLDPPGHDEDQDQAELERRTNEVRDEVLAAIRAETGDDSIAIDDDGDITLRFDSALAVVRIEGDPPLVRVFAHVVVDTSAGIDVLEAVNRMNVDNYYLKWTAEASAVTVGMDLFTLPLNTDHVLRALAIVGNAADEMDEELQRQLGGRTFFGQFSAQKSASYGGYL